MKTFIPPFIRKTFEDRMNLKKVAGNSAWLFLDRIARMIVGLVVGVWVARYLGPNQFGLLQYVIAYVSIFETISRLGLNKIVIREIVKNKGSESEIMGTVFILKLISGISTLLLSVTLLFLLQPLEHFTLLLTGIIATSFVFRAFDVIEFAFRAHMAPKYVVIARYAGFLFCSIIKISLILTNASLIQFALTELLEVAFGVAGLVIAYKKYGQLITNWKIKAKWVKRLMRDSWPLIFSSMSFIILLKIDQVMLKEIKGDIAVGIYAAAVKLSEFWFFIPYAIQSSVYPVLIKSFKNSNELFLNQLKIVMGCLFWFAFILSIFIATFSTNIISILYGDSFSDAARVLSIHTFSGIILCMSIIYSQKYLIEGKTKITMISGLIGAFSNIILNFWFIKKYGADGAAISSLLSYFIPLLFTTIFLDRKALPIYIESIAYIFKRNAWQKAPYNFKKC